jgi:hypothetical protein
MAFFIFMIMGCSDDHNNDSIAHENSATYEQILQVFLDIESFQEYFTNSNTDDIDQIVIADDEIRGNTTEPNIMKFGKPVRFIKKAIIDTSIIGSYYWVIDFVVVDSTARMQVIDPTRDLMLSASFDYIDGKWLVYSTNVQQE